MLKRKKVKDDDTNPLIRALRLSGIVRAADGHLVVRNRSYRRAFDQGWIGPNGKSCGSTRHIKLNSETLDYEVPIRTPAELRKPSAGPARRIPAAVLPHTSPKRRAPPAYLSNRRGRSPQ